MRFHADAGAESSVHSELDRCRFAIWEAVIGKERDEMGWSGVDGLGEFVGCEDADVEIRHLHLPELAWGDGGCCGLGASIR